jgi:hypothetical protein
MCIGESSEIIKGRDTDKLSIQITMSLREDGRMAALTEKGSSKIIKLEEYKEQFIRMVNKLEY